MMNEWIVFPTDKRYRWYEETMMSAVYHGQAYEVIFDSNYDVHLYSEQPINKLSHQEEKGFYETVVPLEELTAVYADRLYAEYKGLLFPLGYVDENFSEMDLLKENSYIDTTELGFQFSGFYHGGYLTVKKEQISRMLAKRSEWPLDELLKKKAEVSKHCMSFFEKLFGKKKPAANKESPEYKANTCHIFKRRNKNRLAGDFRFDVVADYGDSCNGHPLHTWDDGKRILVRCKKCGCYVLIQRSEFHSFTDEPDAYYIDYFAVSGPEEAEELNRTYNGAQLESQFTGPHIAITR